MLHDAIATTVDNLHACVFLVLTSMHVILIFLTNIRDSALCYLNTINWYTNCVPWISNFQLKWRVFGTARDSLQRLQTGKGFCEKFTPRVELPPLQLRVQTYESVDKMS